MYNVLHFYSSVQLLADYSCLLGSEIGVASFDCQNGSGWCGGNQQVAEVTWTMEDA
jgi:hypothetical protein